MVIHTASQYWSKPVWPRPGPGSCVHTDSSEFLSSIKIIVVSEAGKNQAQDADRGS